MDDKKKILILGALFAVILAVGAFQFVLGGGPEAKPAAKKDGAGTEAKPEVVTKAVPNPLFNEPLPVRDPFDPTSSGALKAEPAPTVATTTRPLPKPAPLVGKINPLPPVNPGAMMGNMNLVPDGTAVEPDKFTMTVSGVFLGARPSAVFEDDQGNQRLVAVGEALDGDSRVVSVTRTHVKVRHLGKTVTITVGGEAQ